MTAGRELDAMVATKVMGMEVVTAPDGGWMRVIDGMTDFAIEYEVPHYSTDISAAWKVVEKMRETHWADISGIGRPQKQWRASFEVMGDPITGERDWPVVQIAETAPLAICRAALNAVDAKSYTSNADV